MVKAMHAAGIEVILDVVYNHTAEGNHLGPTLSFKGIDNAAYYRLVEDDQRYYMDYTGTGNSLNVRHPHSLQLIMDSLRYWVTEMHVDGFRFDLASTLAREFYDVDRLSTFFELVQQDPVVSQVKLIAEPWDVGPGGYQVGNFPPQWTEWNGAYRDTVRDFWRGEPSLGEFASPARRLVRPLRALRPAAGRRASTSSPPTTASRCATWCPTTRSTTRPTARTTTTARATTGPGTTASRAPPTTPRSWPLRAREQRNFLATLLLSQGVPMIAARRRAGPHPAGQQQHLRPGLRAQLGALGQRRPAAGRVHRRGRPAARRAPDVPPQAVLHRRAPCARGDGEPAQRHRLAAPRRPRRWRTTTGTAAAQAIGMYLNGHGIAGTRRPRADDHRRPLPALLQRRRRRSRSTLPPEEYAAAWDVVIDTGGSRRRRRPDVPGGRRPCRMPSPASLVVLREHSEPEAEPDHSVAASVGRRRAETNRWPTRATSRLHARAASAPTGCRSPRTSTCSRPPAGCPTCTTSASTGSTSRRCSPPSRAATTATTWSTTTASTRPAAARRGWPRCRPRRGGSGMGVLVDIVPNHVGVATPAENAWWWDAAAATAASPRTRDAFDVDWDAGGGRVRIPVLGDDDCATTADRHLTLADGELRYHDHRFPLAPGTRRRRDARRGPRPPALRAGALAAGRRRPQLPPLLRGQHPRRRSGSRTREVFDESHVEIRRWFDEGLVDGLRVDHPDGLRDPGGYLDDLAELTGGAYVLVEKILEPGEQLPASWATRGHHRLRRAAWSTGCSSTRRARRRSTRSRPAARRRRSTGTS